MRRRPLLRAVAEVVNAVNAVRYLGGEGYLSMPTFLAGWLSSEAAGAVAAASVLDALRRAPRGDFGGRRGRLALLLTIVSWAALGFVDRRAVASQESFEAPLREQLGDDYAALAARERRRRRPGLVRTSRVRRRYVTKADVVRYGPYEANVADVWRRGDLPSDGRAPVLLQVPGGAWILGLRRPQGYPLMAHLAERGWICVSMGYRVSPRHTWPAHVVDVKQALAWIRENIADYGGDPECVAITGGSAGGHLAALAALTPDAPEWQPGFEDADTSVMAAVPIYGRYDWLSTDGAGRRQLMAVLQRCVVKRRLADDRRMFADASPLTRVRVDAPPFFVLHGAQDSIIPVHEGRAFAAALREKSSSAVVYAEIPHAQHIFDFFGSPHGHYTAAAVSDFLEWVRGARLRTP